MEKQRDITFDIMKGIGILLVITCHFFGWNHPFMSRFIRSFHMPLFFLVAGYFSKPYDGLWPAKIAVGKFFNRLYWPLFFTQLAIISWLATMVYFKHEGWNEVVCQTLDLFWVDVDGPITPWGYLVLNGAVCGQNVFAAVCFQIEKLGYSSVAFVGTWGTAFTSCFPIFDMVCFFRSDGIAFCDYRLVV